MFAWRTSIEGDMRSGRKCEDSVPRMKSAPSTPPRPRPHPSRGRPSQNESKTEGDITKMKSRSLPGTPKKKPPHRRGANLVGDDDPEPPHRSASPQLPRPSVFPLDLAEVHPATEVPLNEGEGGGGSPPFPYGGLAGAGESSELKDFVALANWAKRKMVELGRKPAPSSGQTSTRIAALLKDLTTDTFDEEKYKLTRRIESHFNRAYHSALADFSKTDVPASSVDSIDDRSTVQLTNCILPPEDLRMPTTAILTSTTTTIAGVNLEDDVHFRNIYSRPPPLFSHRWLAQTKTTATSIPTTESAPEQAKPGHQRRGRCYTKTRLRGRKVKGEYFLSPDGRGPEASRRRRMSPELLRASQKEPKKMKGKKPPQLEVIRQRGVSIPAGNVAERTAVISISPGTQPPVAKQKKYSVVEVIHQSVNHDMSDGDEDSDVDDSGEAGRLSDQRRGEPEVEHSGEAGRLSDQRRGESEVELSPVSDENGPALTPLGVAQTVSRGSHTTDEDVQEPQRDAIQAHHGDTSPHSRSENEKQDSYSELGNEGETPISEEQDLPGYMPEVKWEEVTVDNRREEEEREAGDKEKTTRNIREAEDRLYQYELRERILTGLENWLEQLVLTGQEQIVGVPPVTSEEEEGEGEEEDHQSGSLQDSEDLNRQQTNVASEAVRTVLYDLVRDRLLGILPRQASSESEAPESGTKRPREVPSPVSYTSSYENEVGTSAPVTTPTSSPRTEDGRVAKVTTPSSSPTPLVPPDDAISRNQRVLTPQMSTEGIEGTHSEEAVATPSLSPPSGRSVIEVGPSVTPAVTPTSSPVRGKRVITQIITSVTPSHTPASSPEKLKPRYPTGTPALSPAGSPRRSDLKYPDACTPGQSPLPSEREMGVVATPPRSSPPSPSRTYDVVLSVPQSPSSPLSPARALHEAFPSRPGPEEAPAGPHRMQKPPQVPFPPNDDRGIQVESYRGIRERKVDLDDSQDLAVDDTPSVVCNSSAEPTVYSPVEGSETTFFTISEGEVVGGQSSVNASVEEGEIARACYLETPEGGLHVACSSHKGRLRPSVDDGELLQSESEIQIAENSDESSSSSEKQDASEPLVSSYSAEDYTISTTKATGSELSLVQDETYSGGDVTAASAESMDALRQENAILLRRLRHLGSFGLLGNQGSLSSSSGSTNQHN
ncbi:uncharacterized protein LOC135199493 [Macrobrachium nipponense]|uniref:uncharacterized protein LOC135199493 n=1 Tax=Macrobrachium nipponense TaxID=159736 RepID=UPI0030C82476